MNSKEPDFLKYKYKHRNKKIIPSDINYKSENHKGISSFGDNAQNYISLYNKKSSKKNISNKLLKDKNDKKIKRLKSSTLLPKNKKIKLSSKYLNMNLIDNLGNINSYQFNTINAESNNINSKNKINKTYSPERSISQKNLEYNYKIIDKENENKNEDQNNNISLYSTQFNNEEKKTRYNKQYYSLDNKKVQKRRYQLLKSSYNFNKYNNDRALIQMINKFKNKEVTEKMNNYDKKLNLFCYTKRIPTKVAFGKGTSTNENKDIQTNFYFNKILKQQNKKNKNIFQKLNYLFAHGYSNKIEKNSITDRTKCPSEDKKSIFIIDSNLDRLSPKDSFGNEIYPVLTKHKILKNILPKEVDYNTKTSIQDIINSEIFPLLRHQKKIMSQSSNLISQELNVLFAKFISLSNMNSDKDNLYKRHDNLIELKKDEKFIELMRSLIGKDKEIAQKIQDKINQEEKKKKLERRQYLLKKFKKIIEDACRKFKRYKIDIDIFFSLMEIDRTTDEYKKKFRSNGIYLFRAIKDGDVSEIIRVINHNVDLVAYKDDFNQIPLHICAKRNLYEIIAFMLSRLSPIDAQDESGRTPLMIATQNNYMEFVTILLFECANPNIKDKNNRKASDMTTNEKLHIILKRAEALHHFYLFLEGKNLQTYIYNGLDFLYKKELEINYEKWINKGMKVLKDASET